MTSLEKAKGIVMLSKRTGRRISGLVFAATMLVGFGIGPASAQTADERTFFTFSGPVELPGVALAPGTYMFRILSPNDGHSVVQVASANGRETYGIFFTLPVRRAMPPNEAEVHFMKSGAGAPPAIQAWWSPDDSTGFEFIYPKTQASRDTLVAGESVRTTHTETNTATADPVSDVESVK
jgi:hypothetical protein